jgi:hypothetical protein
MAYSRYPEDFSSEDLETVSQFVGIATIDSSNWYQTNSDTIKIIGDLSIPGGFTDEQVARFLDVWVRMGLKHPGAYVDGWLTLESPLFTFEAFLPMFDSEWHTWADPNVIPDACFDKAEPFAQLSVQISDWYSWLVAVPVLKLFLALSLYALIIPAYFLVSVLRRKKALLPVLAPVIVTFLGLLISPMVQPNPETMRYLMPFVYTTPVLLCIETVAEPASLLQPCGHRFVVSFAALSPSIRIRAEVAQECLAALLVSGQDQLPVHAACHEHVVVEGPSVGAVEGNGKVGVELARARLD